MKKLYFLNEEEKNRILNLHESATKRQYLGEQNQLLFPNMVSPNPYQIALDKMRSDAKTAADKAASDKAAADKAAADKKTTEDKAKKVQQYRQQITTKTSDITKQIQSFLKLDPTGVMDTGLLQKINDKLNGSGTASAPVASTGTPAAATGTPAAATGTPAFNFNIDPNIGKDGINFNQMTPEEKVQGVQSATPPQEPIAVTTPLTNKEKRQERRDLKKANRAELQALKDKQRGNQ